MAVKIHAPVAAPPLPRKQYGTIYCDPPWSYSDVGHSRRIDRQYPVMKLADICALDVKSISRPDCMLFLWITSPMLLREGPAVLDAWGFTYKSSLVWDKERFGMGHYFRIQHELLLVAVKGKPGVAAVHNLPSVHRERRTVHSRKPAGIRLQIERMYPATERIELFARAHVPGWDAWGFGL